MGIFRINGLVTTVNHSQQNRAEHIIVGSGVMGLMTAYFLHQQGQEVIVLERQEVGQESSWAGGGILSPLYPWRYPQAVTDIVQWSQAYYPTLCDELTRASGIDPEWTRSGLLTIEPRHAGLTEWSQQTQTDLQFISKDELHRLEPEISPQYETAIWMPQLAQVRNPRLVKSLKQVLLDSGVKIRSHTEVTKILTKQDRVTGVQTKNGDVLGNTVVVACGAWSAALLSAYQSVIDVEPVKGQMLLIETTPNLLRHIILANDHYLIPRRDGKILVGSTLEYVGFDKSITQTAREMLTQVAETIAPCLTHYKIINHWAGLRPGSKTSVPTISEHPGIKGLYVNAGHFRNGVVMAPGSAKLMVDLLLNQPTNFNPMYYKMKNPY